MVRTQIHLGDAEIKLLDAVAASSGASRSELIRRAIRAQYGTADRAERLAGLRRSGGSWRGRSYTGAEYVEAIRGDADARRARLGLT